LKKTLDDIGIQCIQKDKHEMQESKQFI